MEKEKERKVLSETPENDGGIVFTQSKFGDNLDGENNPPREAFILSDEIKTPDYHIFNGDCLEVLPQIHEGAIDLVILDLPYSITHAEWDKLIDLETLWRKLKRIVRLGGYILFHAQGVFTYQVYNSNPKDWKYNLIWKKTTPVGFLSAKQRPLSAHEDILVFRNGKGANSYKPIRRDLTPIKPDEIKRDTSKLVKKNSELYSPKLKPCYRMIETVNYPRSVLEYGIDASGEFGKAHPTQKPIGLQSYLISLYSNPCDTILDPTMGVGSVGASAMRTGRYFVGIELDKEYFRIAKDRLDYERRNLSRQMMGLEAMEDVL